MRLECLPRIKMSSTVRDNHILEAIEGAMASRRGSLVEKRGWAMCKKTEWVSRRRNSRPPYRCSAVTLLYRGGFLNTTNISAAVFIIISEHVTLCLWWWFHLVSAKNPTSLSDHCFVSFLRCSVPNINILKPRTDEHWHSSERSCGLPILYDLMRPRTFCDIQGYTETRAQVDAIYDLSELQSVIENGNELWCITVCLN